MSILRKNVLGNLYVALLMCSLFLFSSLIPPTREYQIKAVFLFNFTQFIEWPPNAFASANAPLIIGILGKDPFGSYLDQTVAGEKVNGHPLIVQRYRAIEETTKCHILFIGKSEATNIKEIVSNLKGTNILTVSDVPDFMQQGGMIRFFTVSNKIQFQINPEAAKSAGLTISSKLLRLAKIFTPTKK